MQLSVATLLLSCTALAAADNSAEVAELRAEIVSLRQTVAAQQSTLEALQTRLDSLNQATTEPVAAAALGGSTPAAEELEGKPLQISGYLSSRFSRVPAAHQPADFGQQNMSVFLDKQLGALRLHTELEYEYGPETNPLGHPTGAASGGFSAETAWLDYRYRDAVNLSGGIFLTPTYWGLHHYPSTSLTVENPLMYERIFPANIIGGMLHGSHYFADGGFDYTLYAGKGAHYNQPESAPQDGTSATGGSFIAHVPTAHRLKTFDLGVQLYRDRPGTGLRQQIYAFQSEVGKGPFSFVGEFAHADVNNTGGHRVLFREGYYLQPSLQVARRFFPYYRYDRINFDSSDPTQPAGYQHTSGLTFRPIPVVSLKVEWNQLHQAGSGAEVRNGFGAGLAYFFQ